eukprot:CAMPEP_0184745136 /NCGR_PEP_ID=MMETSP0315-20130426/7828_1 /TAXON_ID=101924 /ORGANISM="Rhodosorus marinus, Strain UTEX LB 2760" /LENGTH=501 /DNA_ID=CAMNT_0027217157 /DNA_START=237 /DNA_END=1742 /DNA_ORIENTATION=+
MSSTDLRLHRSSSARRAALRNGVDWNTVKFLLRIPAREEVHDEQKLRALSLEKMMLLDDRAYLYWGDTATILVGIWFPAKHDRAEILAAAERINGTSVILDASRQDSWKEVGHEKEADLKRWLSPPSERESLELLYEGPWIVLTSEAEKVERDLVIRALRVQIKSRYLLPLNEERNINVTVGVVAPQDEEKKLTMVLDEAMKSDGLAFLPNPTLKKPILLKAPLEFEAISQGTNENMIIGVSARNLRQDSKVVVFPPTFHTSSSVSIGNANQMENHLEQKKAEESAHGYRFKPLHVFDEPGDVEFIDEGSWEYVHELLGGTPTILDPGEVFNFLYAVEGTDNSSSTDPCLSFRTPATIPWSVCVDPEDGRQFLSRYEVSTSVLAMQWKHAEVASRFSIEFCFPSKAVVGEKFNVQVNARNKTGKDIESSVLVVGKGSLLPLRSHIALGRIGAGASVAVNVPCIAFNQGIASFEQTSIVAGDTTWTAEHRPCWNITCNDLAT